MVEWRKTGIARRIAAALSGDGTAGGKGEPAGAETVSGAGSCAERFRDRTQPASRFGRGDRRLAAVDE